MLACGGAGQVFAHTTNPPVATGDGQAMAYRAGAVMRDMEFMQFHPTALYGTENPTLLLTEALRGEGAYLRDDAGERFMVGSHPRAELAPRDVVVRHMKRVFDRDGTDHVWLDARHLDCAFLRERFPTVYNGLQKRGYDLCTQLIPIAPASHYFIGGALTDTWGRTGIPGLFACGETASTGVHGANRLASNSLLEGLVFGDRTVRELNRYLSVSDPAVRKVRLDLADEPRQGNDPAVVAEKRKAVAQLMTDLCGIVRSKEGLAQARGLPEGDRGLAGRARSERPQSWNCSTCLSWRGTSWRRPRCAKRAGASICGRTSRAGRCPLAEACAYPARCRYRAAEGLFDVGGGGAVSADADLRLVRTALAEDLAGYGDITSELTVPAEQRGAP